jgi:hypothetical protein
VTVPDPTISGALITQHRAILVELVGEDVLTRSLAKLPAADRETLLSATSVSFIPIRVADALYRAIGAESGRDHVAIHEQVSRTAVDRALKTIWRLLLRFTSDEALVARTPVIYTKAFPQGVLVPRVTGRGEAEIRVTEWPHMPEYAIRGTRVAIESVLRLAGRTAVKLVAEPTHDGCVYRATWNP